MKKLICLIIKLLCFNSLALADSTSFKLLYKAKLYGLGFQSTINTFFTPLVYSGNIYSYKTEKNFKKLKRVKSWNNSYQFDILSRFENKIYEFKETHSYAKGYKIKWETPKNISAPRVYVGWCYFFDLRFSYKPNNINNSLYYYLNNQAGFYTCVDYRPFSGKYYIKYQFLMPLLGVYSSSEYSSGLPYIALEKEASIIEMFSIGSLNKNYQFISTLSFDYFFNYKSFKKTLRFEWEAQAQTFKNNNLLYSGIGNTFRIGYLFNTTDYVREKQ